MNRSQLSSIVADGTALSKSDAATAFEIDIVTTQCQDFVLAAPGQNQ